MFNRVIHAATWIRDKLIADGVTLADVERYAAKIFNEVAYRSPDEVYADVIDLLRNKQV
jgi:hypothetical protein